MLDVMASSVPAEVEGPGLDGGGHAAGDGDGMVLVLDVTAQDDELVAAHAGHGVGRAHDRRDASGRLRQQLVADVVTQGVVDLLEPVEVEEQQGDQSVLALGPGQLELEVVEQQGPVGQGGQRVVGRLVGQIGLEALALGHVAADRRQLVHRAVGSQDRA